eukprot:COSAG05_NODE_3964_length_1747_cov_10.437500_1_plen_282_part_00
MEQPARSHSVPGAAGLSLRERCEAAFAGANHQAPASGAQWLGHQQTSPSGIYARVSPPRQYGGTPRAGRYRLAADVISAFSRTGVAANSGQALAEVSSPQGWPSSLETLGWSERQGRVEAAGGRDAALRQARADLDVAQRETARRVAQVEQQTDVKIAAADAAMSKLIGEAVAQATDARREAARATEQVKTLQQQTCAMQRQIDELHASVRRLQCASNMQPGPQQTIDTANVHEQVPPIRRGKEMEESTVAVMQAECGSQVSSSLYNSNSRPPIHVLIRLD